MTRKQTATPEPAGFTGWVDYRHIGAKHGSAVGFYGKTLESAYKSAVHHAHYYNGLGDCVIERATLQGVCPACNGNRGERVGKRVRKWVPCKVCKGEGVVGAERQLDVIELLLQADPGASTWEWQPL